MGTRWDGRIEVDLNDGKGWRDWNEYRSGVITDVVRRAGVLHDVLGERNAVNGDAEWKFRVVAEPVQAETITAQEVVNALRRRPI